MPLVTVTLLAAATPRSSRAMLDGVHAALVASGVPATDRFQRVLELDPERLRLRPALSRPGPSRGDEFVLVEILWSVGRSVKVKRKVAGRHRRGTCARQASIRST